jgi:hypothetical protein
MNREEFKNKYSKRNYLGDGLYVEFDGYQFNLIAPREHGEHWVGLEPFVFDNLLEYRKQVYKDAENIEEDNDKK